MVTRESLRWCSKEDMMSSFGKWTRLSWAKRPWKGEGHLRSVNGDRGDSSTKPIDWPSPDEVSWWPIWTFGLPGWRNHEQSQGELEEIWYKCLINQSWIAKRLILPWEWKISPFAGLSWVIPVMEEETWYYGTVTKMINRGKLKIITGRLKKEKVKGVAIYLLNHMQIRRMKRPLLSFVSIRV